MRKNVTLAQELESLDKIAHWMDNRFSIPGTKIRFGLDSLLGLVPGIGDTATIFVTLYLADKAKQYALPRHVTGQIYWNAFIDWLIGLVPFAGDVFDIGWKANLKNTALIRKHVKVKYREGEHSVTGESAPRWH